MFKVTALSVILAAMSVGSAFAANPMDIDFTAMEMAVTKGASDPYKLGFHINLPDFVAEYRCEATLRANTMDNVNECLPTGGNQASRLAFEVENPLPKVNTRFIRKPAISGNLILAFTHQSEGQSEPTTFNVKMPVEYLKKVGKVDNVFTYSSKEVLKVGEQGELVAGGGDGSNDVAEIDSPATFRNSQLDRQTVGGGSTIGNSRTVVAPEGDGDWEDFEGFPIPEDVGSSLGGDEVSSSDAEPAVENESEGAIF